MWTRDDVISLITKIELQHKAEIAELIKQHKKQFDVLIESGISQARIKQTEIAELKEKSKAEAVMFVRDYFAYHCGKDYAKSYDDWKTKQNKSEKRAGE